MSTALPKRGTHIRELFVKQNSTMGGGVAAFESDKHESQRSYDMAGEGGKKKKKGRAPPPPPVSSLGQYKPKILSADNVGNVSIDEAPSPPVRPPRRGGKVASDGDHVGNNISPASDIGRVAVTVPDKPKPFIMGDKDTPLVLPSSGEGDSPRDLHLSVGDLTLTHDSAPLTLNSVAMPGRGSEADNYGTENPLFQMHDEVEDGELKTSKSNDDAAVVTNGDGVAHGLRARSLSDASDMSQEDGVMNFTDDNNDSSEPAGVYIPAPDYDEEEKTMVFPDELDDEMGATLNGSPRRGQKVFKEYHGEDFAQYLSDEDDGSPELMLERHKRAHARNNHHHHADRKSKTEVQRPHYKKREALPSRSKKGKGMSGSNSLRDFSFADSKYGTLGSSKKRHSMPSLMEDKGEAELFVNTGDSYEQFLRMKNGEDLGNVLTDTEPAHYLRAGNPMAPPRYARPSHNSKDTLWKKLTWKFKKQA